MEIWIERAEFERADEDEAGPVRIEGGFDSFERVDIRKSGKSEDEIHVFRVNKSTSVFQIQMNWVVDPEGEELSEQEIKERAKARIQMEAEYQVSHYLKSMDMPPLQSLFTEGMAVEIVPAEEEDES